MLQFFPLLAISSVVGSDSFGSGFMRALDCLQNGLHRLLLLYAVSQLRARAFVESDFQVVNAYLVCVLYSRCGLFAHSTLCIAASGYFTSMYTRLVRTEAIDNSDDKNLYDFHSPRLLYDNIYAELRPPANAEPELFSHLGSTRPFPI